MHASTGYQVYTDDAYLYLPVCVCSDSVRLVNGTSLCSGRLEVKTSQSNQIWSTVCEADIDQQDAEVVCRELGCGSPSVLQGALYGEVEAPTGAAEFQCGGTESSLLDCRRSGPVRNTCSPSKAVRLTCSGPVRLVGGASRCEGTLDLKLGRWKPVKASGWTVREAAAACRELDCGSVVSMGTRNDSSVRQVWEIEISCLKSGYPLRQCASASLLSSHLQIGDDARTQLDVCACIFLQTTRGQQTVPRKNVDVGGNERGREGGGRTRGGSSVATPYGG
uniref:SRCR domain-containing protein n=1 Tax=Xiphophorus couchianus TaxID=32473 RepID=A0A3B5L2X1_9TELE